MDQLVILNGQEQDQLLRAIEAAIHVRRRHQLFLWAQGQFFALLPHEILVCLRLDDGNRAAHVESLHCLHLDQAREGHLCHPQDGLAVRMARSCEENGQLPALLAAGRHRCARIFEDFRADLEKAGLRNAIVHGHRIAGRGDATFFVLFNVLDDVMPVHGHLLRLLLPHLHLAFHHVLADDEE
ncbi:MAG TPA: hypothetical protein VMB75_10080, partial [Rhodocyclaceae bacterium]|nr:hypothetical protein [Rhodocyclaceae bacterium]